MKYGYSNLLGEHIAAEHISYDDCKPFQVVCPICREAVFKVVRAPADLHYLSHYSSAAAYADECELRVKSLCANDIDRAAGQSRNQRLKFFLEVLRSVITDHDYREHKDKVKTFQRLMNRSKAIGWMRDMMFKHDSETRISIHGFDEFARSYIEDDVGATDPVWRTGFAMATQQRIAKDIWASLLTPVGQPNYNWLWNHAYGFLQSRLQLGRKAGNQPAPFLEMERHLARLQTASRHEGEQILHAMAHTPMFPPHVEEPGFRMILKVFAEIEHEMIGCLLRLPYFELLREAGRG